MNSPEIAVRADDIHLELDAIGLGYYGHLPSSIISDILQDANRRHPDDFNTFRQYVQSELNTADKINCRFILQTVGLGEYAYMSEETLMGAICYAQEKAEEGGNFIAELQSRLDWFEVPF